jgi:hypothetical protein
MSLEEAQNRVVELFIALCGAPDDESAAGAADEALHLLDALLAEQATQAC